MCRKQFYNPTVKVWADLDIIHLREVIMQSCVCHPLWTELCQNNFVHRFFKNFHFSWISVVILIKFIHKCMHIHLSPNIPKYKRRRKIHFHEKYFLFCFLYSSIRQLYCCDITDTCIRRVSPERSTYTKLMKRLKNQISWLDYPNLAKLFTVSFLKSSSIHPICIDAWGSFSFNFFVCFKHLYRCF